MSRLVGSGTGLTVKVTFDHKTKAGERTECELVEGRVLQSEGRVAVEAGVPGTPRGLRQLRGREQGGEGVGGSDEEAACRSELSSWETGSPRRVFQQRNNMM